MTPSEWKRISAECADCGVVKVPRQHWFDAMTKRFGKYVCIDCAQKRDRAYPNRSTVIDGSEIGLKIQRLALYHSVTC